MNSMVCKISQFKKQAVVIEMLKMWAEKTLWIKGPPPRQGLWLH